MAPMTEVRQHGPRLSYAEYLEEEMVRTGLSREEVQARDERANVEAFTYAHQAVAEFEAQEARDPS